MKNLQHVLFAFCLLFLGGFALAPDAQAATYSVCASSCDFTTINDAFNSGLIAGDIVTVGATYDLSTDNTFLAVPSEVTLDCQNSGAVLGSADFNSPIYVSVGALSTVQNCNFTSARVLADNGFDATIQNNTFVGNSEAGAISAIGTLIENNSGELIITAYFTENTDINNNIVSPDINTSLGQNFINITFTTSTVVTNNEIITTAVNDPFFHNYISVIESDTVTIQNNLIDQSSVQTSSNSSAIRITGGSHVDISLNRIYMSGILGIGQTMFAIQLEGGTIPTIVDITNNTIKMDPNTCNSCAGIAYTNWSSINPVTADASYNLIAGSSSSTADQNGFTSYNSGGGPGLNVVQSNMGFAGLRRPDNSDDVDIGTGAVVMTGNAAFRDEDGSTADDWELAPYSNFLDINGTNDAGAIAGVRGNSFNINQAGIVDYLNVHALDVPRVAQHLRTGDTMNLSVGTYSPITLTQGDRLVSNVIINGSGAGTVVQYSGNQGNALTFNGISNSVVNGVTFSGSAATTTYAYTLNKALYSFGGSDYNEAGNLGVSPTTALLIGPACGISAADGPTDITNTVDINATDWNIALVQAFGFKLVVYVPNSVASSGVQLNAQCGFIIDAFVNSAFISQGNQVYTYDPAAVATAGVTLLAGESAPSITSVIQENALISLQNYAFGGNDYTDAIPFGAPTDNQLLVLINPCSASYVSGPSTLLPVPETGTSNWNIYLLDQGGFRATVLAPANLADAPADLAVCGVTVDAFVPDVFVYANGGYTYNAAAVTTAGLSLVSGQSNPPYLVPIDYTLATAGIFLMSSDNNTFLFSTVTNNNNGVAFVQSSGNMVVNSTVSGNDDHDLIGLGAYENTAQDTLFDRTTSVIAGDGGITALFSARVQVQDALANPLDAMNVTISSSNSATSAQMMTDVTGNTPYVIFPAFRLSSTDITETAGGYNPQLIHIDEVAPFFERNVTSTLNAPFQTFTVDASIAPPVAPVTPTSGGGGALIPVKPTAINNGTLGLALDRVEKLGDGRVNIWVRLNGNPYTVRGFSLSTDPAFKNTALQNLQEVAAIAVSNATGKVTIYGRYFSTAGEASETYSLTVDLTSGIDIPTVPTTPSTPGTPGESNQCFSSPFTRDLQTGAVAEDVRQLQIFLNAQGFALAKAGEPGSKGFETTRFGAATRNALKAFQKANKLPETGILSGSTRTLVQSLSQKAVTCKNAEKFTRDLKAGMTSDDVKALQQYLNAQGFALAKTPEAGSKGLETRFFGRATFNALKAFQKANKLPETGVFSGATRAKANEVKQVVKTPSAAAMSPFMKYIPWKY